MVRCLIPQETNPTIPELAKKGGGANHPETGDGATTRMTHESKNDLAATDVDGSEKSTRRCSGQCVSKRWTFASMGFVAMALNYMLRVDINVAVVGMVNHTALAELAAAVPGKLELRIAAINSTFGDDVMWATPDDESRERPNGVSTAFPTASAFVVGISSGGFDAGSGSSVSKAVPRNEDGPFLWEETAQTVILSSFFAGYGLTQSFGGRIAEHFSGRNVIGYGLISAALLHFLVPVAAYAHFYVLVAQRVLTGVALGFMTPAMNVMMSKWCPPNERSRMNNVVQSGAQFGKIVAMPLTGMIMAAFGWQLVFYVFGMIAVFLYLSWVFVVHESPSEHPGISPAELKSVQEAIGNERHPSKMPVPWGDLLRSQAFWAICVAVVGNSWGSSMVTTLLPSYLNNMLKLNEVQNGFVSAIPHLAQLVAGFPISYLVDYLRRKGYSSVTTLRKASQLIGQVGAGLSLLMLAYIDFDPTGVLIVLVVYGAVQGFNHSGYTTAMLDIAPNFSGTIASVANIGYNIISLVGPIVAGWLLSGQQTWDRWALIFQISAGCYCGSALVFALTASSEEQHWNRPKPGVVDEESSSLLGRKGSRSVVGSKKDDGSWHTPELYPKVIPQTRTIDKGVVFNSSASLNSSDEWSRAKGENRGKKTKYGSYDYQRYLSDDKN